MKLVPLLLLLALTGSTWAADESWIEPRKLEAFTGAHATDYSSVESDRKLVTGVEGSILLRCPGPPRLQLDLAGGAFSGVAAFWMVAPRLFVPWQGGLVGLSYTLTELPQSVVGHRLAFDLRIDEAGWFSASTSAGYEIVDPGENRVFGELLLHVFPADRWTITSGFSYAQARIKQTRADIIARVEFVAGAWSNAALAVYANYGGNLLTKASAGVTLYFDALSSAERARQRGVFFSRFR